MQISIEPKEFSSELYKVLGVTHTKGPLNIVSNVLLTAKDGTSLTLQATDFEVSVETTVACEVKKEGQLCLNAHNLHSVLKGIDQPSVEITALDNSWAHLKSGVVDCRIVGVPPVEFPALPSLGEVDLVTLETSCLIDMIERTIFSISNDEGRPNLMGAFLEVQRNGLLMVATDGHRLSRVQRAADGLENVPEALSEGIIIPRKSLAELKRTLDTSVPDVAFGVSGSNAIFKFGGTTLMVRLVDGTFPDYMRVIPPEASEQQARVSTAEFTQKLKFVSLFASPRTNNLSLVFDGDVLTISASDPETGEGSESMPITFVGPRIDVGFNYRYLLDILGVLVESEFRFQVVDAFSAALVLDGDREEDLYLVMPMRL